LNRLALVRRPHCEAFLGPNRRKQEMNRNITTEPLTPEAFGPFGDILDAIGEPDRVINEGRCLRYHDRAKLAFLNGRAGISLFDAQSRQLPLKLEMVERHPDGSQAFLPLTMVPFLVVVAVDVAGSPGTPRAFVARPGQGVNYLRHVWHGVLMPLASPAVFAVVDRIGEGPNLEEC